MDTGSQERDKGGKPGGADPLHLVTISGTIASSRL
jgi:hypothetical protein